MIMRLPGWPTPCTAFARRSASAILCRSVKRRDDRLPCLSLLAVRGTRAIEVPNDDLEIALGDRILFAGRVAAENDQTLMLQNDNVAAYVLRDRSEAEGWVWRKLERALAR